MATNTIPQDESSPWISVEFTKDNRMMLLKAKDTATKEEMEAWLEACYPEKHWRWCTRYESGDFHAPVVVLWKQVATQ